MIIDSHTDKMCRIAAVIGKFCNSAGQAAAQHIRFKNDHWLILLTDGGQKLLINRFEEACIDYPDRQLIHPRLEMIRSTSGP